MRLGHWVSLFVLVGGLAAMPACSDDDDNDEPGAGGSAGTATGGTGTTGGQGGDGTGGTGGTGGGGAGGAVDAGADARDVVSDGEIVGILHAANTGEILQAQLAEMRAMNPAVRTFAAHMNQEHALADSRLMSLSADAGPNAPLAPVETGVSQALTMTAMQKLQVLQTLFGATFDRQYMTDQVEMHTEVLKLIDEQLLPSSMDGALRMLVTMMRESVAAHLAEARNILQMVNMDGG
jgi:putative membrane protein